jgi:hypothetical protein
MNTKNESEVVLAFYRLLHQLVTAQEFDSVLAKALVATYNQTRDHISLGECTMKSLRSCHREYHDNSQDLDRVIELSEAAFADLAGQMRNPEAQKVCQNFREASGTFNPEDLYLQVRNVRLLSKSEHGPAVITLVTHSGTALFNLLRMSNDSTCAYTHFSQRGKGEFAE